MGWGSAAALAAGGVLLAVLRIAPYAFLHHYPQDIRRRAAEPTPAQRRAGRFGGLVVLIALLATVSAVVFSWGAMHPTAGLGELMLMALVAISLFVLVDIVLIDWLVICTWRPRAIVLPGTEDCPGWHDYGHHVREQFRPGGLLVLAVGSALIGLLAWWLT